VIVSPSTADADNEKITNFVNSNLKTNYKNLTDETTKTTLRGIGINNIIFIPTINFLARK
jgi:hypothetical protein